MTMRNRNIERLYNTACRSALFASGTLDYDWVTDTIIRLAETVHDSDVTESDWYIDNYGPCLADVIVGSYWHYTEWHGGQWSKGYAALSALSAALSALSTAFNPGMTGPETDNEFYQALNAMAQGEKTMSHFYAQIPTSARKTVPSARGHKSTGVQTVAAGWQGAIRTEVYFDENSQSDRYRVWLTPWMGSGGTDTLIAEGDLVA